MAKKTSGAAAAKPKATKKSSKPKDEAKPKAAKKTTTKPKAEAKPKAARKKIDDDDDEDLTGLDEDDDDDDDSEPDFDEVDDDMISTEEDEGKREPNEILIMLRETDCAACNGSSTKRKCKIRDEYGCPDDKAKK